MVFGCRSLSQWREAHSRCRGVSTTIHPRSSSSSWTQTLHPSNSLSPFPWKIPFYFLSLWISLPSKLHMSEIIQYLSFCDWLTSPSTTVLMYNNPCCSIISEFPPFLRLKNIKLHEYILYFLVYSFFWWTHEWLPIIHFLKNFYIPCALADT